jgi:7-carboxy-7-deazaguanine synthase
MRVYEIFRSIQGETSQVGRPMWFVRLAGCDLECSYCDTPAARDRRAGRDMTIEEVLAATAGPPRGWCMITGGEPLLQLEAVNALVAALAGRGDQVLVETSGAHPTDRLHPAARRIVDVKTPGSGMAGRMHGPNFTRLRPQDEAKFVLTGRADYDWAKRFLAARGGLAPATVLFGAAQPALDPKALARWIVEDGLPVRLNLQIHKVLGLP